LEELRNIRDWISSSKNMLYCAERENIHTGNISTLHMISQPVTYNIWKYIMKKRLQQLILHFITCNKTVLMSLSWMGGKWYRKGKLVTTDIKNKIKPCVTAVASPIVKQHGKADISCKTPHVPKLPTVRPHVTLVNSPVLI